MVLTETCPNIDEFMIQSVEVTAANKYPEHCHVADLSRKFLTIPLALTVQLVFLVFLFIISVSGLRS